MENSCRTLQEFSMRITVFRKERGGFGRGGKMRVRELLRFFPSL